MKTALNLIALIIVSTGISVAQENRLNVRVSTGAYSVDQFGYDFSDDNISCSLEVGTKVSELVSMSLTYRNSRLRHSYMTAVISNVSGPYPGTEAYGDIEINSETLMLDMKYEPFDDWKISPFVIAGIGITYHDIEDIYMVGPSDSRELRSDDNIEFSYEVGVGLTCDISKNLSIDVTYIFQDAGNANFGETVVTSTGVKAEFDPIKLNMQSQIISVGLSYRF